MTLKIDLNAVEPEIIDGICAEAGVTFADVRGPSRLGDVVEARRALAEHLRNAGWTFHAIGRFLARDHSSVVKLLNRSYRARNGS